jgi:hypothetical protein
MVQSKPVPAHAMQLRKLRRSMPSFPGSLVAVLGDVTLAGWLTSTWCCAGAALWIFFMGKSSTVANRLGAFLFRENGINRQQASYCPWRER